MIYITGGCHGGFDRFENDKFSNLTKNDYVIICGDFGGILDQNKRARYERKRIKQLSKMKFTTLFVDGNHENFDRLYSYPIIEWHGGKVHKINSSIFHLMRGEIYEIDNKKIFAFGGASCHDIPDGILDDDNLEKIDEYDKRHAGYRIRGYNWWDLELPTDGELRNGLDNLCKVNNKVDYIISHCAPTSIQNAFNPYYPDNKLTKYFEEIKDKVEFKKWYFGHYHKNDDTTFDKFACLYEKIIEIK